MKFSEKNIKFIISLLKGFYLTFTIILAILLIAAIFLTLILNKNLSGSPLITLAEVLIAVMLGSAIYLGLKNKKPWVISIIVFSASISLLPQLLYNTTSITNLIFKVFGLVLSIFEIYFFTRKEVRQYFGTKRIFLFGR